MPINLPAIARQRGIRRNVTLRPITITSALSTDLAAIMAPAWQVWRAAIPRIIVSYTPRALGDTLTRDTAEESVAAIEAAKREFLTVLVASITPKLRDYAARVERWHRNKWIAAVNGGLGVDLSTVLTFAGQGAQETIEAFVARNVALVSNVSDQAQARIADTVFRGYQQRLAPRAVAKELSEAVGLARKRAVRIASDQASKLGAALDDERMADAGLDLWRYRHSGKRHAREEHKARDGNIYTLQGRRQVKPDGSPMAGGSVIAPGDGPGEPPFCACVKQAYIPLLAEIERN